MAIVGYRLCENFYSGLLGSVISEDKVEADAGDKDEDTSDDEGSDEKGVFSLGRMVLKIHD